MNKLFFTLVLTLFLIPIFSQTYVEGYAYQTGNRGFIKDVKVTLVNLSTDHSQETYTDQSGKYRFPIDSESSYAVILQHDEYIQDQIEFASKDVTEGETLFLSHELNREPGYIFEITIAEKNQAPDAPKDQMKGALVEVYNNTKEEIILVVDSLNVPDFKVNLKKGNHYTILIRHPEFLSKRMEAFVDVEGCILCFEGIGDVRPGVSDNLTENNSQGTLLANVELEKFFEGKIIALPNIYYDYNSAVISSEAAEELKKAAIFINDNPNIKVELSSHTDSRGRNEYNKELSQRRSDSAVRYLIDECKVNPDQIEAIGYGEEKLLNDCTDGIECNDQQHQDNRRTELKLLNAVEMAEMISLAQMKREEQMDRMIAELSFGSNQIKVTSEDQLPSDVENSTESDGSEKVDSNKINSTLYKSTESNGSENFYSEEMYQGEQTEAEQNATYTDQSEMSSQSSVGYDEDNNNSETSSSGLIDDKEFNVTQFRELDRYTGFKIVIHFSRFALSEDHDIFMENQDIIDFVTRDNNHLYMLGDFDSRKKAMNYLVKEVRGKYPSAYLVGFKDGIRVE